MYGTNISKRGFKQSVTELPQQLLILTLILPVVGFLSGYFLPFATAPENTRLFLSTLAGAQAGILAIVFSVTVIGVQLVGTRYSPRMISLFTDSPIFIFTYLLFIVSVALDLFLLYTVPIATSAIHSAGVGAASGLAVTAAATLFTFVKTAIRQSTPDGAIDSFVSRMSTERYLAEARKSAGIESGGTHPLHPLFNLTMNALSKGERVTTGKALSEYGELAKSVLSDLDEKNSFENEEQQVIDELSEPVLTEHLKEIALHAEEQGENSIAINAIEFQTGIGKQALEQSNRAVAIDAQFGLSDVIRDAPVEAGSSASSNTAWRNLGQFLVDSAKQPDPETVRQVTSSIEKNVSQQLSKTQDIPFYDHAMMHLYRNMAKAQNHLLEHYGNEVSELNMDWQHEHPPQNATNRKNIYAVHSWRDSLLKTTESFLQYAAREGLYPITEGNFKDSWKQICIAATESRAENYAVTLCQALIEIAVIDRTIMTESGLPWSAVIGEVKHKGDPEIVDRAFDRILEYNHVDEDPGVWTVEEMETRREKYYTAQINLREAPALNTRSDYPSIIEEIRSEADTRFQQLEE